MSYVINLLNLYATDLTLALLYVFSWIVIVAFEKNRANKITFAYSAWYLPLFILNPLVGMVLAHFQVMPERFVRVYWLLPAFLVIAYAASLLVIKVVNVENGHNGRMGRCDDFSIVPLIIALILLLVGAPVVNKDNFVKAENVYKLPDGVIQICDILADNKEGKVAMPMELSTYARQYDGKLHLLYGRYPDTGASVPTLQVYELMKAQTLDAARICSLAQEENCNYLVLDTSKTWDTQPMEGDITQIGNFDKYCVYKIN